MKNSEMDNQTNIKVGTKENSEGKTDIKGAVIASGSYKEIELPQTEWKTNIDTGEITKTKVEFQDNNNLTLETKNLTYSNINDFQKEETKGFQFGTGAGGSTNVGESALEPKGSTTIGLTNKGSEKEQETRATIGNGSIFIAGKEVNAENGNTDLIRDLNRDVNKLQEITKDMITGALDGSMTVDNRLLTSKGRESIAKDFKNFGGNTSKALSGATTTIVNPFYTAYNVVSNDKIGMNEIASQWKANQNAGANMININKDVINNLSKGQSIADIQEATGNQVLVYGNENDKVYGFYDNNGKQIIYEKKKVNIFVSDNNLLFKVLYALVPGAKSSTDQHDILMNKYQINSNLGLGATIAPSFATTYYGAIGTVFDFKNYGSNATKIKDSYDNSVPNGSIIINNQTGKIKVKFNPDPNFDYKGINIIRGKR